MLVLCGISQQTSLLFEKRVHLTEEHLNINLSSVSSLLENRDVYISTILELLEIIPSEKMKKDDKTKSTL